MEWTIKDCINDRKGGKLAPSVIAMREKRKEDNKNKKSESGTVNPKTESVKMSSY